MAHLNELTNGTARLDYSTKETAQFIREALKKAFHGVKFSVRTSYASMTSSTHVEWTDGPTEPEVERVTNRFTSKSFNGMDDSTHYHSQDFNGQRVQFSGWVHTRRNQSVALLEKALARYQVERAAYGLAPANVTIKANGSFPFVDGPDANADAAIHPCGYHYAFRCVSDAVSSIAYTMRPNGVRITLKERA